MEYVICACISLATASIDGEILATGKLENEVSYFDVVKTLRVDEKLILGDSSLRGV
jgi:hypothetical protein